MTSNPLSRSCVRGEFFFLSFFLFRVFRVRVEPRSRDTQRVFLLRVLSLVVSLKTVTPGGPTGRRTSVRCRCSTSTVSTRFTLDFLGEGQTRPVRCGSGTTVSTPVRLRTRVRGSGGMGPGRRVLQCRPVPEVLCK